MPGVDAVQFQAGDVLEQQLGMLAARHADLRSNREAQFRQRLRHDRPIGFQNGYGRFLAQVKFKLLRDIIQRVQLSTPPIAPSSYRASAGRASTARSATRHRVPYLAMNWTSNIQPNIYARPRSRLY